MAVSLCTIDKIRLTTVCYGKIYEGTVDLEGCELADVELRPTSDTHNRRQYHCTNCDALFNGSEGFGACQAHLGNVVEQPSVFLTLPKAPLTKAQATW